MAFRNDGSSYFYSFHHCKWGAVPLNTGKRTCNEQFPEWQHSIPSQWRLFSTSWSFKSSFENHWSRRAKYFRAKRKRYGQHILSHFLFFSISPFGSSVFFPAQIKLVFIFHWYLSCHIKLHIMLSVLWDTCFLASYKSGWARRHCN